MDEKLGITKEVANEIDFSFEKTFVKSISDYIKPENIFFVDGFYHEIADNLIRKHGGIHCMVTEIPQEL